MPRRTPLEVYIAQTTDRSLRYEARMRAAGLTKACVWVPTHCVDALKETAEKWRADHEKAAQTAPSEPP
jgi:hypothetical protein